MNQFILDKTHPSSFRFLFQTSTRLIKGTSKLKFIEWVKKYPDSLDHNLQKNLNLSVENFEE